MRFSCHGRFGGCRRRARRSSRRGRCGSSGPPPGRERRAGENGLAEGVLVVRARARSTGARRSRNRGRWQRHQALQQEVEGHHRREQDEDDHRPGAECPASAGARRRTKHPARDAGPRDPRPQKPREQRLDDLGPGVPVRLVARDRVDPRPLVDQVGVPAEPVTENARQRVLEEDQERDADQQPVGA